MTVQLGGVPRYQWTGLSGDTKPVGAQVNNNDVFFETDTGNWYVYTGAAWVSFPGATKGPLATTGVPLILPSSGTLTGGGALSAITALAATYANCYMYFPANAVATVSAAGMYYVIMSSTTAGTVYNNPLALTATGSVVIPTVGQRVACTTASSYTSPTASNIAALTVPIPANAMGPNGRVRMTGQFSNANSANTKTGTFSFGAAALSAASNSTNLSAPVMHDILNRAATNVQVTMGASGYAVSAAAPVFPVQDTTVAFNVTFNLQLVTAATDTCQWDFCFVELFYGA